MNSSKIISLLTANWIGKAIALLAALLVVILYSILRVQERSLIIPLEVILPQSFRPVENYPVDVQLILRGSEEDIGFLDIEDFQARVDFSDVNESGEATAAVVIEKRRGLQTADVFELRAIPEQVTLTLERSIRRRIDVEPQFIGAPQSGFQLEEFRVSPATVEIEAPEGVIDRFQQIQTRPISLTDRRSDFSTQIDLVAPNNLIEFPAGRTIEIFVVIGEAIVLGSFDLVNTVVLDLPSYLTIGSALPEGKIRVQARQSDLDVVESTSLLLEVDASAISNPGTYQLPVRPDVPPNLLVLGYEPTSIRIEVLAVDNR